MLHAAVGLTRAWTATYTRGLPQAVKVARRLEIESDLWEQQRLASYLAEPAPGTGMHVLARCVLGMASDVSWRVEADMLARRERKIQVHDTLASRLVFGIAILAGLLPVVMGGATLLDAGISGASEDMSAADSAIFGAVTALAGAFIVTGLLLIRRSPRVGLPVLVLGVVGITLWWYWMAMITIPIGVAVLAIAYFRARRNGWPRGTGTA
jgi:hypothetical protein